jgi:Raf kinase inhibitor-like YbhB/YbcL family protein
MAFMLSSPAFKNGEEIPSRYTGDGANVSSPLEWSGAPSETRSFVLIKEDLDAPTRRARHWGLYDIMPERVMLPEAVGHGVKTEPIGHCINDFAHSHYDGPAPPDGDGPHRYLFTVAALDIAVPVPIPKEPIADLWEAARSHIIAETSLLGTYSGRRRVPERSQTP